MELSLLSVDVSFIVLAFEPVALFLYDEKSVKDFLGASYFTGWIEPARCTVQLKCEAHSRCYMLLIWKRMFYLFCVRDIFKVCKPFVLRALETSRKISLLGTQTDRTELLIITGKPVPLFNIMPLTMPYSLNINGHVLLDFHLAFAGRNSILN